MLRLQCLFAETLAALGAVPVGNRETRAVKPEPSRMDVIHAETKPAVTFWRDEPPPFALLDAEVAGRLELHGPQAAVAIEPARRSLRTGGWQEEGRSGESPGP